MKDFLITKKVISKNNNISKIWGKKKEKEDTTTFIYNIRKKRGLISTIKELVTYCVLDKMLAYDYKYEHAYFLETEAFKTPKGYIKYISKTLDTRFDFVFNDIEAKHYNGFKTFITINTRVYKFLQTFERMRPLRKISLYTKRLEGLYPKQKEFYNLTGGNKNYHTMEIMTDMTDKTSTFSNIFTCFTYLKKHIITVLSNINHLLFKTLFDTIFVHLNYKRHKFTALLNGFTATFKKSLYRFKFRYIPRNVFKNMKRNERPKRTRSLYPRARKSSVRFLKSLFKFIKNKPFRKYKVNFKKRYKI